MKKSKAQKLELKKTSIVELNSVEMKKIIGGTDLEYLPLSANPRTTHGTCSATKETKTDVTN